MGCLGVHFALTDEDAARVLARVGDDGALLDLLEEGELADLWKTEWVQESDKAWDAIDRCLTYGLSDVADSPRSKCVLGGRRIYGGDDHFMALISPTETKQVAEAVREIDEGWMRERYFKIDPTDYGCPVTEQDFGYTWEWFQGVQAFFERAASADRSVLFSASQ